MTRYIVHLDMDAFFAAVEQRDNPSLIGKPVIIGSDPKQGKGRGVVSTCSYEARKFGVHSAMPVSKAWKLCPNGVYLPGDHKKYSDVSQKIMAIMYQFSPDIEPISIDEAFLDITNTWHLFESPKNLCLLLKQRIKDELDLTCSVGLAPSKLIAKLASDLEKPDGLVIVKDESINEFLNPLKVERMWGVGKVCLKTLHKLRIYTIGDLASSSEAMIRTMLGDHGVTLQKRAQGIDYRPVGVFGETKSVSNEHTFNEDTSDIDQVMSVIMYLSEKVAWRLQAKGFKGRKISIKIRTSDFKTFTRDKTIDKKTNYDLNIFKTAKALFNVFLEKSKNKKLSFRLIGVKVSSFVDSSTVLMREQRIKDIPKQLNLFDPPLKTDVSNSNNKPGYEDAIFDKSNVDNRPENIKTALVKIRNAFGKHAISRGISKQIDHDKPVLTDQPIEE